MTSTRRPASGGRRPGAPGRRTVARTGDSRAAEWYVVLPVVLLSLLGVVMVYSASSAREVASGAASWSVALKQVLYLGVGAAGCVLVARARLSFLRDRLAVVAYAVAFVALFVVLVPGNPMSVSVNGATRWLALGPLQFQPSELAKPALVLWLARYLDLHPVRTWTYHELLPVFVGFGMLAAMVMAGDDLGTTALLSLVMLTMIYMAGVPGRTVAGLGGIGALGAVAVLMVGDGFRVRRLLAFLQPEQYRLSEAWQLHQSQIGLASGGLFGSGPGYSRAKWGYLGPEAHTDFILAVIGEELGLFGTLVVVGCVVSFMWGGSRIALGAKDQFGRLVAVGVTAWIGFQALIHIGVTIGTLPTKGITLPFVSYGGSSLVVSLLGVGLLLAVARDR
ncbi:MAG: FtsW/RodA/SpoVE family cell cycle protein [Actinomycetes bacterium]